MKWRTYVRTYIRTDAHDVMAIKPNFLTSMGHHIFLTMVLRERTLSGGITLNVIILGAISGDKHMLLQKI